MEKIIVYTHSDCLAKDNGPNHPERKERLEAVLESMKARGADFSYLTGIQEYIMALPFETYNFMDYEYLGADDCEFVDGFHGGEVVYQRMIASIIGQNPNSALVPHVNIGALLRSIRKSSGHVLTAKSATEYTLAETDFLQIGCQK